MGVRSRTTDNIVRSSSVFHLTLRNRAGRYTLFIRIMNRPTDKLLKDMSNDELRGESQWHAEESERLMGEVRELRERAIHVKSGDESMKILMEATEVEHRAEAHRHQSRVLLAVCRPTEATPAKATDTPIGTTSGNHAIRPAVH